MGCSALSIIYLLPLRLILPSRIAPRLIVLRRIVLGLILLGLVLLGLLRFGCCFLEIALRVAIVQDTVLDRRHNPTVGIHVENILLIDLSHHLPALEGRVHLVARDELGGDATGEALVVVLLG